MFRERLVAKIFLPIFTVFMVFSIFIFGIFSYLRLVVVDVDFLKDSVINNSQIDDVYDEIVDDILENSFYEDYGLEYSEAERVFKEFFDKEFVSFVLDETMDALINGDTEIDEEYIDDWIDDNEDILEELGLDRHEIVELKEHVTEVLEVVVEDSAEEQVDLFGELEESLGMSVVNFTNTVMLYSGVVTLVMLGLLFLMCRNKFAPIRNFGISLTVADSLLIVMVIVVWMVFQEIAYGDSIGEFAFAIFENYFNVAIIPLGSCLVLGILLIVLGAILGSRYVKYKNSENDDNETDIEEVSYNGNNVNDTI